MLIVGLCEVWNTGLGEGVGSWKCMVNRGW